MTHTTMTAITLLLAALGINGFLISLFRHSHRSVTLGAAATLTGLLATLVIGAPTRLPVDGGSLPGAEHAMNALQFTIGMGFLITSAAAVLRWCAQALQEERARTHQLACVTSHGAPSQEGEQRLVP